MPLRPSTESCTRTLAVYDWTARTWQVLDTREAKSSTEAVAVVAPGQPARFLGGSSIMGVVRVRVSCSRADATAFTLQTDRLTLSVG
ncbi:MAG: hypothetical protein ACXWZP_02640 [Gaiellaceae bacterium]